MTEPAAKPKRPRKLAVAVDGDDHVRGPLDAPLTLVEYGDYECGVCAAALPVVAGVREALGDELRFVFRHFPLRMHPHAERAAEAAEAAGAQGRFWEWHDLVAPHPDALADDDLRGYARRLGLDDEQLVAELDAHRHLARVEAQRQGGVRSRVRGTPAFYVNGRRFDGEVTAPGLLAALTRPAP